MNQRTDTAAPSSKPKTQVTTRPPVNYETAAKMVRLGKAAAFPSLSPPPRGIQDSICRLPTSGSAFYVICVWITCLLILLPLVVECNHDAKRLYDDLLRKNNYNRLVRPVSNNSAKLEIKLGLKLSQLVDVDEKNEILATNMWLLHEWKDNSLQWEPEEYGGVSMLYVPSTLIWLPDIVLYNNADGDYTVTLMTKATLTSSGTVRWEPPVIFKSRCDINVMYYPFDEQLCRLKFGSWSYDGNKVDLRHIDRDLYGKAEEVTITKAIDLTDFYDSVEWDIIDVPAKKNIIYYPCCVAPYPDVTFNITIRRKTLYYAYTLIIPCVSINMLTLLAFYLPCECGEKISICISILLSLSLFQLLLMDLVPATSTNVSLLGKFLLFTSVLVSMSVFFSVVILNVNHRNKDITRMPRWTKHMFLDVLPKLLLMRKPEPEKQEDGPEFTEVHSDLSNYANPYKKKFERISDSVENVRGRRSAFVGMDRADMDPGDFCEVCALKRMKKYEPNIQKGLEGIAFIAKHLKDDDDSTKVKEEWKYAALVLDRILLWVYVALCFIGTLSILLNAPSFTDNREALSSGTKLAAQYNS